MKSRIVLIAIVVSLIQIGIVASAITGRAAVLRNGTEVTLDVVPVDPRDLLRGDYVILNYPISTLDRSLFENTTQDGPHLATVYVLLRKQGEASVAVAARYGSPFDRQLEDGEVQIAGSARVHDGEQQVIGVRYGIERYYVPEGEGRAIEQAMRESRFRVVVAVAADGTAQVKRLLDGNVALHEQSWF